MSSRPPHARWPRISDLVLSSRSRSRGEEACLGPLTRYCTLTHRIVVRTSAELYIRSLGVSRPLHAGWPRPRSSASPNGVRPTRIRVGMQARACGRRHVGEGVGASRACGQRRACGRHRMGEGVGASRACRCWDAWLEGVWMTVGTVCLIIEARSPSSHPPRQPAGLRACGPVGLWACVLLLASSVRSESSVFQPN